MSYADDFFRAYVECALWSSHDWDDYQSLDANYCGDDLDASARTAMRADCDAFVSASADYLADIDAEQAGHDFWLTRNRHGAGFWDRGLGELGDRLTDAALAYGEQELYVGDDGRIYVA